MGGGEEEDVPLEMALHFHDSTSYNGVIFSSIFNSY